jgi:hypothetical protein
MRNKLTMEDHLIIAKYLRNIDREITSVRGVVFGRGVVTRVGQRVFAVDRKLSELKCVLDGLMFRDHPNDKRTQPKAYYGPRPGETA